MTKVVDEKREVKSVEKNDSSEYVTLNLKGLSLPWAILLSVAIFTAGIGSALYFGLKARPVTPTGAGVTPTPTVQTFAANEFAEVSIPFKGGPTLGDNSAKVVVLEFSDLVCPYCKKFHDESFATINKDYIETGKVKFVYKHYPLAFHNPAATISAQAAYCVETLYSAEKMYSFNNLFFAKSSTITQNAYDDNNQPVVNIKDKQFYALFGELGVDSNKIKNCIKTTEAVNRVKDDSAELSTFEQDIVQKGVTQGLGTPTFVIGVVKDGVLQGRLVEGAYPIVAFKNIIEEQLGK